MFMAKMMPSRGIQIARGHAPRLYQLQCRNLSSTSRRFSLLTAYNTLRLPSMSSAWRPAASIIAPSALAIRYASSTPTSAPPLASPPPSNPSDLSISAPASGEASFPNLDTISIEGIELDAISNVPEKLGYLHEVGINYGYGMTSTLQWIIEHLHVSAGLPWWGAIVTTAVLMRLTLLPLFLRSSDQSARSAALAPIMKPIQEKSAQARANKDNEALRAAFLEMRAARKQAGLSFAKQLAPMVLQGYIGFCGFRLIRAMSNLPVPAFVTEGPGWLQDLTVSDPYLVLPLAMAGTLHLLARMGGETGAAGAELSPAMMKTMLYGLPVIVFVTLGFQPAALCLWFAAGGAIGIAQALILKQPAVRRLCGIAPIYKPPKTEKPPSIMDMIMPAPKVDTVRTGPSQTMGKSGAYMNPVYQAPKLNRNSSTRTVIDVKATSKLPNQKPSTASRAGSGADMVQPSRPTQGVVKEVSKAWNNLGPRPKAQSGQKKPVKRK